MTKVRFKKQYVIEADNRVAYELVNEEPVFNGHWCACYDLKILGLVPIRKLEPADGTEIDAIDVVIKLTNT